MMSKKRVLGQRQKAFLGLKNQKKGLTILNINSIKKVHIYKIVLPHLRNLGSNTGYHDRYPVLKFGFCRLTLDG